MPESKLLGGERGTLGSTPFVVLFRGDNGPGPLPTMKGLGGWRTALRSSQESEVTAQCRQALSRTLLLVTDGAQPQALSSHRWGGGVLGHNRTDSK